jgi:predicted acetyltransferase
VGGAVARRTLRAHPGDWEIAFQDANTAAARFWRAVAEAVAAGPVSEERRPVPDRPELPPDCWLTFRL